MSDPNRTLDVLRDHADPDGHVTLTDEQIGVEIHRSRRTATADVRALLAAGKIEKISSVYFGTKHVRTLRITGN